MFYIVSGIFEATLGKGFSMNEMHLSTGFMNGVTSLFVPNLCSDQGNKVAGTSPPTKRGGYVNVPPTVT